MIRNIWPLKQKNKQMKKNILNKLVVGTICLLFSSYLSFGQNTMHMDLSGDWNFRLDKENIGIQEKWFNKSLVDEIVTLPGTTDENQKGNINENVEVNFLTKKYWYEGKAWYQREIDIPQDWEKKTIQLFLEHTKATEVWVDGTYFPQQKGLTTPHIYNLTESLTPGKHTLTILVDNTFDLFPVGGSHALAIHTQTNWNGIIGTIELVATDEVYIHSVKLYPDIDNKEVKIVFQINNPDSKNLEGEITCIANGYNGNNHNGTEQTFNFSSNESKIALDVTYEFGDGFATWDEFNPNLYNLSATLLANSPGTSYHDTIEETFGMLDFKPVGTQFEANGKTIILRGKHDACVFPLTGYPPMAIEGWVDYMKIVKEYGLNHVRFHSWTPPEAAFEAADMVGVYIQTELPNWRSFHKEDTFHYNFQMKEGMNILDTYGNHPSMVMLSLGNELGGDRQLMAEVVDSLKAYDSRILFAQGSNNYFWNPGVQDNEDFFVSARVKKREENYVNDLRASFSYYDDPMSGLINGQFPNTTRTFESALKYCNVPAIAHETGQYQIIPDFDETSKYTGVFEPRNFGVFKQRMKDKNMFFYWEELYQASGLHAAMCYKDDNEISMRTTGLGGFQILDLQDFPGQGTALVGMLDAFMDSKGFITSEEWRQSCAPQTIQAEMLKLVWQNNEVFTASLIAINYGESDMVDQSISWAITGTNGEKINEGITEVATYSQGGISQVGKIEASLESINEAKKLTLTLSTQKGEITNTYEIWVYPIIEEIEKAPDIEIVTYLGQSTLEKLQNGKKVLLIPDSASIANNSTGGLFISDYWCYPMFKQICENSNLPVSPGTLGLLIDDKHPVFNYFPTESHSDWQWWSLMKNSYPIVLDATDADYRPIVQAIDNFDRCSKLGLMFEFAVGSGKLLVCSTDLSNTTDYVAQNLFKSILTYMDSDSFSPKTEITPEKLLEVIYREIPATNHDR